MNNEELLQQILSEVRQLNNNFRELFDFLKSSQKSSPKRSLKVKLPALTEEEIKNYQNKFTELYKLWLDGFESKVQDELESYPVEDLRRFGDANNLNVTSRMSKDKVMQQISIRFREKKLLTQNINISKPLSVQIDNKEINSKNDDET
jgi:hypothetical protein